MYILEGLRVSLIQTKIFFVNPSYHTTHTKKAERRAEKQRQRQGASSFCFAFPSYPKAHSTKSQPRAQVLLRRRRCFLFFKRHRVKGALHA